MKRFLLSIFFLLSSFGLLKAQSIFYSKPSASGNGSSWAAAGDFQTMINGAAAGDSVFAQYGTYQPAAGSSFSMKEGVEVYGGFLGTESSLSSRNLKSNLAAGDSSILEGNGNSVINNTFFSTSPMTSATILDGFTIMGGATVSGGGGGGIYDNYASPTLSHLIMRNNSAGFGGGIFNVNSSPVVTDVIVRGDSATSNGGGVVNNTNSNGVYTNVLISDNSANSGAGMFNNINSSPKLINVTIAGNTSNTNGGGITNNAGTCNPTIVNSIIYGNTAVTNGNGVYNNGGANPNISYSLVQDSTSTANGNISSTGITAADIFTAPKTVSNSNTSYAPKKGADIPVKAANWQTEVKESNVSWHYAWNANIYDTSEPVGVEYVPLVFAKYATTDAVISNLKAAADAGKIHHLLGFNEPDNINQANMSVDTAIALWPKLESVGVPLVSPACVDPLDTWMQTFMHEADSLNYRVDYIAVHMYKGTDVNSFINELRQVYNMYHRPIWITEFAVADYSAKTSADNKYTPAAVLQFMQTLLPILDTTSYIQRYAWFSGDISSAYLTSSALYNPDGSLTTLGKYYANH